MLDIFYLSIDILLVWGLQVLISILNSASENLFNTIFFWSKIVVICEDKFIVVEL